MVYQLPIWLAFYLFYYPFFSEVERWSAFKSSHLWCIWVLLVSLSGFHVVGCFFFYCSFSLSNRRPPDQYLFMQKKMKCIMSWLWQNMNSAFFDFLASLVCFSYYSFHFTTICINLSFTQASLHALSVAIHSCMKSNSPEYYTLRSIIWLEPSLA